MDFTNPERPRQFSPPTVGEWIGCEGCWYQLGPTRGNGAFGVVYDCTDEWGNDLVAKVILPQGRTYAEIKERWRRELENLMRLRHPNITYIHQAFEYRDTFYLILERCDFTLTELIENRKEDGEIWLPHVARDVLHALDFAHRLSVVHKDLHPGNVFVFRQHDRMVPDKDPVWLFKIADLGISRIESEIGQVGTTLAQWMVPPEFLDPSEFGPMDRHVDVYHAGLLLLSFMLGYVPTFSRDQILAGAPKLAAQTCRSPYSFAIAKALRRHVAHRTPSAIEFWREIKVAAGGSNPPLNSDPIAAR